MSTPLQRRGSDAPSYRFGRYTLVRPLGVGGMAQVWLARKDIFGGHQKVVALKLPADLLGLDKANAQALLNEIAITSQFSHSNIVQVFDAGVHRGVVYVEMERVDGIDLDQLLHVMRTRNSPVSLGVAVYIWRSVLEALHYAYTYVREGKVHPVIHRDLNPSNVLISSSGEVKVMDFGIAKMLSQETSGLHVKGKVRYMPKEQALGYSSTQVDIYGAAAMFWEMIEGKRFRHHIPQAQMVDHALSGKAEPMTSPRVDEELRQLYELCTHPDPAKRPANPAEVIERLKLWLGRVADASDLRELYTWQLEAKRHSGFTEGDFEIPHDIIRLVEILRAIDAQEAESSKPVDPPPGLQIDAAPDAPSFVRRPYRSSDFRPPDVRPPNVTPTEDAPIPGKVSPRIELPRAEAKHVEPPAPSSRTVPGAGARQGAPALPTQILTPAFPTANGGDPTRVEAREPSSNVERLKTATVIVNRGTRRQTIVLAGVAAVFVVALIVVLATLWPQSQPPVATASPRAAASEPEAARVDAPEPVLTPISVAAVDPVPAPRPSVEPTPTEVRETASTDDGAGPDLTPPRAKFEADIVPTPAKIEPDVAPPAAKDEPSRSTASEPASPATDTTPKAEPTSTPTKPRPKPTMIEVRLAPHFAEGELRIGRKTFAITKTIDVMFPAGTHAIAWRPDASSEWRKAGKLHLSAGNLYTVRLGSKGVLVSSSPKGTP